MIAFQRILRLLFINILVPPFGGTFVLVNYHNDCTAQIKYKSMDSGDKM